MAALVFFDPACSSFAVPLRWETSKIMTTGRVREAGEWYCVVFYRLSSETSLIFQLASRAKHDFQIHCYCNFSSGFANVTESKIPEDQWKLLLSVLVAERGGRWDRLRDLKRPKILLMNHYPSELNSNSHWSFNHKLELASSGNFAQTFKLCYLTTVMLKSIFCVV